VRGAHPVFHRFLARALGFVDVPAEDSLQGPLPEPIRVVLQRTLAEIMGLAQGYCKGRGGSMHLRWAEAGALGTNAIVGGGVPFANGVARALKRKGKGDVVFTSFGRSGVHIRPV